MLSSPQGFCHLYSPAFGCFVGVCLLSACGTYVMMCRDVIVVCRPILHFLPLECCDRAASQLHFSEMPLQWIEHKRLILESGPMLTAFTITARMYTDITVLQMQCSNNCSLVAGLVHGELCIDTLTMFPLHCTFSCCQLSRNVFMATDSIIRSLLMPSCQMCLNLILSSISMVSLLYIVT